jgi:hypothetical protein
LELIVKAHDCEIGICWGSINSAITVVLEARKTLNAEDVLRDYENKENEE